MGLELVLNWVIKSSMMASILAVLILLVKYALGNKLDAKWQYAIWMVLIIRLLIPCDIQSPWSIYSLIPKNSVISPMVNQISIPDIKAQIGNNSGKGIQVTKDQPIINQQSSTKAEEPIAKNLSIGWIVAMLWLVGALILAILTLVTNLRFHLLVRREPAVTDARMSKLMQECTNKMDIRRNLPIIITNRIDAPCLYGIVSPKLLLPKSLVNRLNDENIRYIFIHELSHYKRKDILINWLAVAAQIVHWFNPLIWYSFARMREDCELACDADTLSYLRPEEYQSYGLSIISLLTPVQSPWFPGTTGFFGNKNNLQIKRRIKMIKLFKKPTLKWTWTVVVIFISLGLIGFTNSISNATPETGVLANSNATPNTNPPTLQVEPNKLLRGNWNLTVTAVKFSEVVPGKDKKGATIEMTIENAAGHDKAFLPNGYIAALVGTSGTVYKSNMKESLDQKYNNAQEPMKDRAKRKGETYNPGEFKIGQVLPVDPSEENFTKVIYQDEKGQQIEIPIQGITPEIIKPNPDAK